MMHRTLCALAVGVLSVTATAQDFDPNYTGTYSIIGLDPVAGELGMAVQSKAFAVGNRTMTGKGGLVVVAQGRRRHHLQAARRRRRIQRPHD